jgi:hypothetical protein
MFKNILVAAAVLGTIAVALPVDTASAQTVRRHLHCNIGAALEFPGLLVGPISLGKVIVATNNWSFAIPKGTKFTVRVGNSSKTTVFTSKVALAPGAQMLVGTTPSGSTCDVHIPG